MPSDSEDCMILTPAPKRRKEKKGRKESDPCPVSEPAKKIVSFKNPKSAAENPKSAAEKSKDPLWYDLYYVLSETGDHMLKSLIHRPDVALDVKDTLRGVLALRESRDLFHVEGTKLSAASALYWSEELRLWANDQVYVIPTTGSPL